jgi:hypothetical protein
VEPAPLVEQDALGALEHDGAGQVEQRAEVGVVDEAHQAGQVGVGAHAGLDHVGIIEDPALPGDGVRLREHVEHLAKLFELEIADALELPREDRGIEEVAGKHHRVAVRQPVRHRLADAHAATAVAGVAARKLAQAVRGDLERGGHQRPAVDAGPRQRVGHAKRLKLVVLPEHP